MKRALAYCAYLDDPGIPVPQSGVNGASVRVISEGRLRVLWSEVEWPFAPEKMQQNAVEFHAVITCVFARVAAAPFRLLSVFENGKALAAFVTGHAGDLIGDLERLKDFVQMECVLYVLGERGQAESGTAYLRQKAEALRRVEDETERVRNALRGIAAEVRVREGKNGRRVYALVARGNEGRFREMVRDVPQEDGVSRRTSGPWPAAEFLSEKLSSGK
ncbi:MAG TPA: GvpL/GvpF family gas vesicle protein [Terriglobales bacterium]|nr:GvpL/GvpF family gas vesicle protein [Terriglobales bacterium]